MISDRLREQQISPRNEYDFSKASPSGVPRSTKGSASFSSSSTGGASLGGSPTQSRWLRPGLARRYLSTGNALVAGLRQRSKIYGPASLPPLVLAAGARGPGGPTRSPRARRGSSSVVWLTASFPLTNPPTLFWLHYSAYFSSTYRRYLDRPTVGTYLRYGTEYQ